MKLLSCCSCNFESIQCSFSGPWEWQQPLEPPFPVILLCREFPPACVCCWCLRRCCVTFPHIAVRAAELGERAVRTLSQELCSVPGREPGVSAHCPAPPGLPGPGACLSLWTCVVTWAAGACLVGPGPRVLLPNPLGATEKLYFLAKGIPQVVRKIILGTDLKVVFTDSTN